jgi:hypothetical protein
MGYVWSVRSGGYVIVVLSCVGETLLFDSSFRLGCKHVMSMGGWCLGGRGPIVLL